MADLTIAWNNEAGLGDICVDGPDLVGSDDLATAVLVSLFTERRAQPGDLPEGDVDRRGWFGDQVGEGDDPIGSLLWLLDRRKLTNVVLALAQRYAFDALEWMIGDGVALGVDTTTTRTAHERMGLVVQLRLPSGDVREFEFADVLGATT